MEEAPVGDHEANGIAQQAVKSAQGRFRVLKDALESGINKRFEGDHQVAPLLVTRAATVINEGRKDDEGLRRTGDGKGES